MRPLSVLMCVGFCLSFFLPICSPVGGLAATLDGCATCPNAGGWPLPPEATSQAAGRSCIAGQCRVPLMRLVPRFRVPEPVPTLAPRKPIRTVVKKIVRPIKTVRESRKSRGRWIHRPGRHGPRRLMGRLRHWRPLRHLRGCCR